MLLNEYEIAERILKTRIYKENKDLFIIAKYLQNEMCCDEDETYSIIKKIISNTNPNYDFSKSYKYLEKMIKKASKQSLVILDYIIVTDKELKEIEKLESYKLRRLIFTLLVYAKYNNAIFENNNDWCNISIGELYKKAKVSTRNTKEKATFLNRLNEEGYISLSKKNTNLNIKCLCIDKETSYGLKINDLRELGYQYINIYDSSQFIKCEICGVLTKKKSKFDGSTRYCNSCKTIKKNEQKFNSFQKLDQAYPL